MNKQYDLPFTDKRKAMLKSRRGRFALAEALYATGRDFKCAHCHNFVSSDPTFSGVNNRNHCPYCLWSRHLDLYQAGDRLAACKAPMRPVGLTIKRTRKKYGHENQGELMLIHLCTECGKVSINRIAADDDVETVFAVYENSLELESEIKIQFEREGINLLESRDVNLVQGQLLGRRASPLLGVNFN